MTEGFDPATLMARALEMQQRLIDAQAEAESETVEGIAGGGKVRVTMTGAGEVTSVRIDPSVVDPNEVDLLEDLILAALRDAATRVGTTWGWGVGWPSSSVAVRPVRSMRATPTSRAEACSQGSSRT